MGIVRTYTLTAAQGLEGQLEGALRDLAGALAGADGSQGTLTLRSQSAPSEYRFLELWRDEDARKAAGPTVDKAIMQALMGALDGKPGMEDFDQLGG
jgi:hypothetical protein